MVCYKAVNTNKFREEGQKSETLPLAILFFVHKGEVSDHGSCDHHHTISTMYPHLKSQWHFNIDSDFKLPYGLCKVLVHLVQLSKKNLLN